MAIGRKWARRGVLPSAACLLMLAGCAVLPPRMAVPQTAIGPCRLVTADRMALLPADGGKPVVTVAVNGRMLRMQVDSGAETSVLTRAGAARLGLAPGPDRRRITGLGGTASYPALRLDSLVFGGQAVHDLALPLMTLQGADGLDGLIGADLLAAYQVAFDFAARRLTLYRAQGCATTRPPWDATELDWAGPSRLPIVGAMLDGRRIAAVLDTGANLSAVDQAQAGIASAALAGDPRTRSFGAGGTGFPGRAHRFGRLDLGDAGIGRPVLRVVALARDTGIGLVVGMDILGGGRLWLDYAGRRAWLALR